VSALEDPKKAIQYVLIFLPGFLSLGLAVYVTKYQIGEFAFTYFAIALSLGIYACAHGLTYVCGMKFPSLRRQPNWLTVGLQIPLTFLFSFGVMYVHEKHWLMALSNKLAPDTILRISDRTILGGLIHAERNQNLHTDIDKRDSRVRMTKSGDPALPSKAPYALYVRADLGEGNVYEGRIVRFEAGQEKDGFPIVLSPACRVVKSEDGAREQYGRITGPGVFISGKDIKSVELYEAAASLCKRCFDPRTEVSKDGCFDVPVSTMQKPTPK